MVKAKTERKVLFTIPKINQTKSRVTKTTPKNYTPQKWNWIEKKPVVVEKNFIKIPYNHHMLFRHPFTMIMSGPTQSGKSTLLARILDNKDVMFKDWNDKRLKFKKIAWHHDADQHLHKELKRIKKPRIKFERGLPDEEVLKLNKKPMLLIIDDLMKETPNSDVVGNIFTKISHHNNISVIYLIQNLFANQGRGGNQQRDISLNSHYVILMKNPRDALQPKVLGAQMDKRPFMADIYDDATKKSYGYLMLDFTQQIDDLLRFRTHIFPDDSDSVVYIPTESMLSSQAI